MRIQLQSLLATLCALALLTACGKSAEEETANTPAATAPQPQESAANATGTTTFYGDDDAAADQAQPANE